MASRGAENRTGQENFHSQTEIRSLPKYNEIHNLLSLNHSIFPCSLSCMKMGGGGLNRKRWGFKFILERGDLLERGA